MNFWNSSQGAFLKLKAGARLADGSKLESDVDGKVIGAQTRKVAPFTCES